jgi:hypothetical protein
MPNTQNKMGHIVFQKCKEEKRDWKIVASVLQGFRVQNPTTSKDKMSKCNNL